MLGSMKAMLAVVVAGLCGWGAGGVCAEPPADGLYVLARQGEGPAMADERGQEWVLAGRVEFSARGGRIQSIANDNTEFHFSIGVPCDDQVLFRGYGLLFGGVLLRYSGASSGANESALDDFTLSGEDLARRIADWLGMSLVRRRRPDSAWSATFTPAKPVFERGEVVTATLRIINDGPEPIAFQEGGMNRGFRDNQYQFTARLGGAPVPDIGISGHSGGLSCLRVLQPGEAAEATAFLNDWFAFDEPGTYEIQGAFHMEFFHADRALGRETLWVDAARADFAVEIAEAAETADPETAEPMGAFLARMGETLGCAFTVEDFGRPGRGGNPTLQARVDPPPPEAIRSVDDLLLFLTNRVSLAWEGRRIPLEAWARQQDGVPVVALFDAGLRHQPRYRMDRSVGLAYEGATAGLLKALAEEHRGFHPNPAAGLEGASAKVPDPDMSMRDVLSRAMLLGGQRGILWRCRAWGSGESLTVEWDGPGPGNAAESRP